MLKILPDVPSTKRANFRFAQKGLWASDLQVLPAWQGQLTAPGIILGSLQQACALEEPTPTQKSDRSWLATGVPQQRK